MLAGYDWGGRAACVVAALWPERVRGLVTCGGYNMHDIAGSAKPASAEQEHRYWYQYYFHTERGRAGPDREPARHRAAAVEAVVAELDASTTRPSSARAASFDNPDFVDVVIHSYRHRFGYVPGDPALAAIERKLRPAKPPIGVPAITLQGEAPGTTPPEASIGHARFFTGAYQRRTIPLVGHTVSAGSPARDRAGGDRVGARLSDRGLRKRRNVICVTEAGAVI